MTEMVATVIEGKTVARIITQGHLAKFLDDKDNVIFQVANYRACMFDSDGMFFDWHKVEDVPVYVAPEPEQDTEFDSDPKEVETDSPDNHVDTIDSFFGNKD